MEINPSNTENYLRVGPSLLENGGDGLFTKVDIRKNTVFSLPFSIKTTSSIPPVINSTRYSVVCYTMPLFVSDNSDLNNNCIVDGRLTTLTNAPYKSLLPLYAHIPETSMLMKCNDFAWEPGIFEDMYEFNTIRNKMEIILVFTTGKPVQLAVITNDFIKRGIEVGLTYGFDYWYSGSVCTQKYKEMV